MDAQTIIRILKSHNIMKKHNYIAIMASLIAMVIISLSFFGCKQNEDPDPGPLAVVLKFKNPDYKLSLIHI